MRNCEACQGQMLEYLYDLLEDGERQQFEEHLSSCAGCQAALSQARDHRSLLAAAARLEFAQVTFQPPKEDPVTVPLPAARSARRPVRAWQRWAMAAAVLLGATLAVPASWVIRDYTSTSRTVQEREATLARLRTTMNESAEKLRQAPQKRDAELEQVKAQIRANQIAVQLDGPQTLAAGMPAEYRIHTRNLDGVPLDADLTVQTDNAPQLGAVASNGLKVEQLAQGEYRLKVPASLTTRANVPLSLMLLASRKGGYSAELHEILPVALPEYVTQLATDKPMYQPGEVVYFRSLTLERSSRRPAQEELQFLYTYTTPTGASQMVEQVGNHLLRKEGTPAQLRDGTPIRGIGSGAFLLPEDAPGGEYVLEVREISNRFPVQQRKFVVNRYQKPRLNKELDFNRKTYGVGDEVQALCKATRADGGPVKERPVEVTVQIDGQTYDAKGESSNQPIRFWTDSEGKVTVRFKLPAKIEKGQASLGVKFDDGGNTETLMRPLPIVVKAMQVELFPEGGDLVAGLSNRVYFQARTPLGKPADIKGRLLEDGKPLGGAIQTLSDDKEPGVNQGMGKFEFTPTAGKTYQLRIESPKGIEKPIPLPMPLEDGVTLRVDEGQITARQALKVHVQSSAPRDLVIGVTCRGQLLGSASLAGLKGQKDVEIKLSPGTGGVCRVTVYEKQTQAAGRLPLVPRAERLIYRQQSEQLHLAIKPDRLTYVPGQKVTVGLEARNEEELFTPAVLTVAVVDKSVVTLADEKTARTMPTHFLLTSDVKKSDDLEYADFLLGSHPKAAEALDLLLGVHGWRHFTPAQPQPALPPPGFAAQPGVIPVAPQGEEGTVEPTALLASTGVPTREASQAEWNENLRIRKEYDTRCQALSANYSAARQEADKETARVREDKAFLAASARLQKYHRVFEEARTALPVLAVLAVLVLLAALAITLGQSLKQALPCYAAGAACALLLCVVVELPREQKGAAASQEVVQLWQPAVAEQLVGGAELETENRPTDSKGSTTAAEAPVRDKQANNFTVNPANADPDGLHPLARRMPQPGMPVPTRLPLPPNVAPVAPAKADLGGIRGGGQGGGRGGDGKEGKDFEEMQLKRKGADADPAKQRAALLRNFDDMKKAEKPKDAGLDRFGQPGIAAGKPGRPRPGEMLEKDKLFEQKGLRGPALPASVVREYAHQRHGSPELRSDFAETLFWHPAKVLENGKAEIAFELCDSATSFQVTAFGHTLDGRLGVASYDIESRLPFTVQPKVPLEVTSSDRIDIPLSISNNTDQKRTVAVTLEENKGLELKQEKRAAEALIDPESAQRRLFRFQPNIKEGEAALVFQGQMKGFAPDTIRMGLRVVPEGFPIVGSQSDLLEQSALARINLPETWVKGTLKVQAHVYPSTLADLQKGLESLLREPHGCFEQTSTSNYPNLLILDYLRESDQSKPNVEAHARDLLARGYQKLVSFECLNTGKSKREGYEWFGGTAPAHEALTAYGLLQFRDLTRVQDVDKEMLERTRQYLLSRRDGKGGFLRNPRALDTFGRAPDHVTAAYIVWALTESGPEDDLSVELKALSERAAGSKDPYFLALVANSLINRARTQDGVALLKKVAELQKAEGSLQAEYTSITGSGGRDLEIETTSLAVLGWLKANTGEFKKPLDRAISWIGKQRGGYGGFGSTQATILALKALIGFAKANKRTPESGELTLLVDERKVASEKFPAGVGETMTLNLDEAEKHLKPGMNKVRLEISGKNTFPYTLGWSYQTLQPASAENCTVKLATRLTKTTLNEEDTVRLNVTVTNTSDKGQGMATAIVGLPAGLNVPEDQKQLREYIRLPEKGGRPQVDMFEIRGRELVLYWRDLGPKQTIELPVDLIARVPGEYSGPASRAYLYYNADHKHWIEPLKVAIKAKE